MRSTSKSAFRTNEKTLPASTLPARSEVAGRARLLIFFGLFVIFVASPVTVLSDSRFALLTSQALLKDHTPSLSRFVIPGLDQRMLPARRAWRGADHFYQLVRIRDRVLYAYPHGSSFLSVPFVAALDAVGVMPTSEDRNYDAVREAWLEKLLASLLMAVTGGLFFEIAVQAELPVVWSTAIAAGGALGTQVFSSASRTLWSESWEVFLATCIVLLLLNLNGRLVHSFWLGTLLAWMFFVRPTAVVPILAISGYLWLARRPAFIAYVAALSIWMGIFVAYWFKMFSRLLPDYYHQGSFLALTRIPGTLPAILLSPSRGLLIFVPTIPLVLFLVARYWRVIDRGIASLALSIICFSVLVVACYPMWWGGWCYGPRLLTETIPWFVLLTVLTCRCLATETGGSNRLRGLGVALILVAIGMNAWGAVSIATVRWNSDVGMGNRAAAFWDWRHPQFLAGLISVKAR